MLNYVYWRRRAEVQRLGNLMLFRQVCFSFCFGCFVFGAAALILFAGIEALFFLRMSYWLAEAGLVSGVAAAIIGAAEWLRSLGAADARDGLWRTGCDLLVLTLFAAAWISLGGFNGAPATTGRDITLAMFTELIAIALLVSFEVSVAFEGSRRLKAPSP